jgi:hypothetical protein
MIRALLLIFDPAATWERIFRARRSVVFILLIYLCPFLLLNAVAEGYGLVHIGKKRGILAQDHFFMRGEAVIFEAGLFLVWVGVVFLGAKLVKSIGETFHGRHTMTQAFATVAYGLAPLFLLRLCDGWSQDLDTIPWVIWALGTLLAFNVLYYGVPRMMEPDPSHAFGLFLMSSILLMLITGLLRFVTVWYLKGEFTALESFVSDLGRRLPF